MKTRTLSIIAALSIALVCLAILAAVLPAQVTPARADSVASYNTVQILAFGGVTTTQTGSAFVAGYGQADCYAMTTQAISPTTAQTVTFALSHSWDRVNWVSLYSFTDQTTNTVDFTRTLIYGNYLRAQATLGDTGRPVTGSVVCVLKNVQ